MSWVHSYEGMAFTPPQVFYAVSEPSFSAPKELTCVMAFDGYALPSLSLKDGPGKQNLQARSVHPVQAPGPHELEENRLLQLATRLQ